MKVVIVIPTYNEAENIAKLIPLMDEQIAKFPQHEIEMLIVDGNSPDGTGEVVKKLGEKYPYAHLLLEKEKAGIGAAYIYGFKHAMKEMKADAVVEMDGDLQHRPEDFTKMLKKFDEGYDYVIGSRYVKGGSIPKEWAFYRKFLSVVGNIVTKVILGIYSVNDFTTGFKISRVKGYLDKLDLDSVNSLSFAYKMDLLFKMHRVGAKIIEVPIKFGLRDRGASKMETNNPAECLRVVLLLRYEENKSFIKFVVTGFVGLGVDTGLFSLLKALLNKASTASAISGFVGMCTTYTINNFWSFGDRKHKGMKKHAKNIVIYMTSSYVPIVFISWLIGYSINTFGNYWYVSYGAFFVGILIGLIWNYTVYSKLIWKKSKQLDN